MRNEEKEEETKDLSELAQLESFRLREDMSVEDIGNNIQELIEETEEE